jgi:hypothetical protein
MKELTLLHCDVQLVMRVVEMNFQAFKSRYWMKTNLFTFLEASPKEEEL